jgi:hypothetical protein
MAPALACLALGMALGAGEPRALLGPIRWDAWHTPWSRVKPGSPDGPVAAMVASLGPQRYHWRLPFFAQVVDDEHVRIDGYTQEIVDREIAFARAGGLDYFAFLLYAPDSPMSQGLALYLSSARKADLPFCAIASPPTFGGRDVFAQGVARVVKLMREPSYLRVAGGRPLLYLFDVNDKWIAAWGGLGALRPLFDGLRRAARDAGCGDPYLVVADSRPEHGKQVLDAVGAQALTAYATQRNGAHAPYADLTRDARAFWERCAATGAEVVPIAMSGWDRRPRAERPVPWESSWQKPGANVDRYYQTPTPEQLADHLAEAAQWAADRPRQCPAEAVLVYAWNEHDEGGWLCPTLNADGTANDERLRALARRLGRRPG